MKRMLVVIANAALPGSMLPWHGAAISGATAMISAMMCASVIGISLLVADPAWWLAGLLAYIGYLLAAAGATVRLWFRIRPHHTDTDAIRRLHREAASAFLRDDPSAVQLAVTLTRAAPQEPGAWRLLQLLADHVGDTILAARAARRVALLESAED